MLTETGGYYKRKAAEWINQDSCPDHPKVWQHCWGVLWIVYTVGMCNWGL